MTFEQWANNPMGPKSSVVTHREMFRTMYKQKLDAIMMREMGKVDYQLFFDKADNRYAIHIKIPSEVVPKFYYDVVIEFTTKDPLQTTLPSLAGYNIRVFSNDPAFVYTWVYAYNKNNLYITELSPKMSKRALKNEAKTRNPINAIGYCKSIYFAYLIMKSRGLFLKAHYTSTGLKLSYSQMLKHINHADKMIDERQEKGSEVEKARTKAKQVKKKMDDRKDQVHPSVTNRANPTERVPIVSSTKSSNVVSKVTKARKVTKKR